MNTREQSVQAPVETTTQNVLPAVFRDARILKGVAQLAFLFVVVLLMNNLGTRINTALDATNQTPNFEFLQNRAGFGIADSGITPRATATLMLSASVS